MSGRHKRKRQEAAPPPDSQSLWIRTEPRLEGGGYFVTVSWAEDYIVRLDPAQCLHYVTTLVRAAQQAEYDAAVLKQLTKIGVPLPEATLTLVNDLRQDRPPLDDAAPGLRYEPGVTQALKPFLKVLIHGEEFCTMDLPPMRRHAMHLLEAPDAADLDSAYRSMLVGAIGLDSSTADNVVADIANYRHGS